VGPLDSRIRSSQIQSYQRPHASTHTTQPTQPY
jgi:hypothetical protein